jgi:hypothetical protein
VNLQYLFLQGVSNVKIEQKVILEESVADNKIMLHDMHVLACK